MKKFHRRDIQPLIVPALTRAVNGLRENFGKD
jgi:hypothetical protein